MGAARIYMCAILLTQVHSCRDICPISRVCHYETAAHTSESTTDKRGEVTRFTAEAYRTRLIRLREPSRTPTSPFAQGHLDTLQDYVVDFDPLVKRCLS
jgi:hypothetical protein